ncbi:MAG: YciI family protein [Chitinophaga rupis]
MNQFIIIVRGSDHTEITSEEMQQRMALFGEWVQKVLDGRYVSGAPLEETDARLLKSKTEVFTDGPFIESKEMISGYMVINAKDIDEAVELTKLNPLLGKFQLEVRKLKPMM